MTLCSRLPDSMVGYTGRFRVDCASLFRASLFRPALTDWLGLKFQHTPIRKVPGESTMLKGIGKREPLVLLGHPGMVLELSQDFWVCLNRHEGVQHVTTVDSSGSMCWWVTHTDKKSCRALSWSARCCARSRFTSHPGFQRNPATQRGSPCCFAPITTRKSKPTKSQGFTALSCASVVTVTNRVVLSQPLPGRFETTIFLSIWVLKFELLEGVKDIHLSLSSVERRRHRKMLRSKVPV